MGWVKPVSRDLQPMTQLRYNPEKIGRRLIYSGSKNVPTSNTIRRKLRECKIHKQVECVVGTSYKTCSTHTLNRLTAGHKKNSTFPNFPSSRPCYNIYDRVQRMGTIKRPFRSELRIDSFLELESRTINKVTCVTNGCDFCDPVLPFTYIFLNCMIYQAAR